MSNELPITKDSGSRREFDTGSVRDAAAGKGRYDLISPLAMLRLAQLYERGADKYKARNWEKGQPQSVYIDCAMRHLQKHLAGHRDEDHLAAAAWNVFAMMHQEHQFERGLLPKSLDDLPMYLLPGNEDDGDQDDLHVAVDEVQASLAPTRPSNEWIGEKEHAQDGSAEIAVRTLNVGDVFTCTDGTFKVTSHEPLNDMVEAHLRKTDGSYDGSGRWTFRGDSRVEFKGAERND